MIQPPFILFFLVLWGLPVYAENIPPENIPPFSTLKPGQALPTLFRVITIPKTKLNLFSLVEGSEAAATVLQVESNHSAGSLGLPFAIDPHTTPMLKWRWKVNRVLEKAEMDRRTGDDFAARVYVFFEVPLESLSFTQRTKIRLARMVAGPDVPTAALCYVWDNRHPVGYTRWSPYTERVRKIVLQSGSGRIGQWVSESRDVAADFRSAFGAEPPRISGVAIGNDTDQTKERVTAWFSEVTFTAK